MKKFGLLLLSVFAVACSPRVAPPPAVVLSPTHDTIVEHHYQRDSVYVDRHTEYRPLSRLSAPFPQKGQGYDTVIITQVTERWRIKHDSIYVGRVDTIPIVQRVEVERVTKYVPWYYRYPALAMYALVGAVVGLIAVKVALKV